MIVFDLFFLFWAVAENLRTETVGRSLVEVAKAVPNWRATAEIH